MIAYGGVSVLKDNSSEWADDFYSETKNFGNTHKGLVLLLTIPIYIIFRGFEFDKILMLFFIFLVFFSFRNKIIIKCKKSFSRIIKQCIYLNY